MVLYSLVPGDYAIHKPTGQQYRITEFDAGRFTGRTEAGATITADMNEFEPAKPAAAPVITEPAKPRDAMLMATAQRISDLQEQVNALQKKLQTVQNERDTAEHMLAELTAASAPPPQPQTRIETRIQTNIGEQGLARYLNEGWGILHMQFIHMTHYDGEQVVALNVVLQREVPVPPPPQPEQRAAAPQPAPVRTVTGTVIQEPAPAAEPADVYASILRRHDLPISERLAMMDKHIFEEVGARHAARVQQSQPFQPRPLITTGVQS